MKEQIFESKDILNAEFSAQICELLTAAIAKHGRASLLVSGGSTPLPLFQALSNADIAWDKVDISLVDERWVEPSDSASNEKLVRENLLQNQAAAANFIGLKTAHDNAEDAVEAVRDNMSAVKRPFTVLILGMGEDGHTASLFPCSEQVQAGLDMSNNDEYIAVQPTTAPNQRMSLTLKALLNSSNIFLHLTGDKKKQVLDNALAGDDLFEMPIRAVLKHGDVELMWAP